MSNDPRDLSGAKLSSALLIIGRDLVLRSELVAWLQAAEKRLTHSGSVRDDVTGPIVDALHHEDDSYEKTLEDGTKFGFLYRTKIARDFLMSERSHPSHVWEPQTTRLLVHFINGSSGDALVGGAYCGDQAVLMARAMSSTNRKVHCFEPNPVQSDVLSGNGQRNSLTNLVIRTQGLWDEAGLKLRLQGYDSFANSFVVDPDVDAIGGTVETETIDAYVDRHDRSLSLIMLDIEGGELRALQGALHVLSTQKPAVVFEVHRDYVDWSSGLVNTPIVSLLASHGYHVFALRDFNGNQEMGERKIELIPADAVYLEGPHHGFNMVALPDSQCWDNDLFRIVRDVSPKLLWHKSPSLHHPTEDQ